MAKPTRKKSADRVPDMPLAVALDFIKAAQHDKVGDLVAKTHCRLANGYAVAFDGILAIGHPTEEADLNVCPHTFRLVDALKRCKKAMSITQLDNDNIAIKSGNFRVVIPCLNPAALPYTTPDNRVGDLAPTLKAGFEALNPFISGTGHTIVESSLLLSANSMVSTDRTIMLEYWHGINLPNGLVIPKAAITAVAKVPAPPVGIGVSDRTITFWYENGAWIRTQLYTDPWPEVSGILNNGDANIAVEPPRGFFEAVQSVAPHSITGNVHTTETGIASDLLEMTGATYTMEGLTPGLGFNAKHLLAIEKYATRVDLVGVNGVSYFYGDNIRGALAQRKA